MGERQQQMKEAADVLGCPQLSRKIPFLPGVHPVYETGFELYRANSWEPAMAVIGMDGIPSLASASPALQPSVKQMVAIRLPPLVDPDVAWKAVKEALERDPPCGASVVAELKMKLPGFHAKEVPRNFKAALSQASKAIFDGNEVGHCGMGGSIPLMNMLQNMFPDSALVVCGILGPGSNEHGPNESMDIAYTKKFTACLAMAMGLVESDTTSWPDDVPRPAPHATRPKKKSRRKFCFNNPAITIGNCACCF